MLMHACYYETETTVITVIHACKLHPCTQYPPSQTFTSNCRDRDTEDSAVEAREVSVESAPSMEIDKDCWREMSIETVLETPCSEVDRDSSAAAARPISVLRSRVKVWLRKMRWLSKLASLTVYSAACCETAVEIRAWTCVCEIKGSEWAVMLEWSSIWKRSRAMLQPRQELITSVLGSLRISGAYCAEHCDGRWRSWRRINKETAVILILVMPPLLCIL